MKQAEREAAALSLIPGLGNQLIKNLMSAFPPGSIFKTGVKTLQQIEDIGAIRAASINAFKDWEKVDALLEAGFKTGATLMLLSDPDYPQLLRQLYDPPPMLWVLGNRSVLSSAGIAVVGTRSPSPYGRRVVESFVPAMVDGGLTVFSGLAYGIDTLAHRKTLDCGGTTVAVLGSGINWIYPATNQKLAREIFECGGAVITEFLPGTQPDAGNFPSRNRIVSGLSRGVFVVESGAEGGSMITARMALDQSRDVFAAPHAVESAKGEGCNILIRDSLAKLVITPADILAELNLKPSNSISIPVKPAQTRDFTSFSALQRKIVDALSGGELHIDDIATKTDSDLKDVSVDLLELELEGRVRQLSGKRFILLQ